MGQWGSRVWMAEGSTGTAVYGSRQLSITHSHSLKGRLQCSCPVSLSFAVPYFILSMLKHCSNASPAAHTHIHKHTMTYILITFWWTCLQYVFWLTDLIWIWTDWKFANPAASIVICRRLYNTVLQKHFKGITQNNTHKNQCPNLSLHLHCCIHNSFPVGWL